MIHHLIPILFVTITHSTFAMTPNLAPGETQQVAIGAMLPHHAGAKPTHRVESTPGAPPKTPAEYRPEAKKTQR